MAEGNDTRPPRGALIVIAVGLIATLAAAALANENLSGDAAHLEWVQSRPLPDSDPATLPGGAEMRLTGAGMRATGANVSGYALYRSAATLRISRGAPIGSARILCAMRAPGRTEIAQTPNLRASYPRSSPNLIDQEAYEVSLVEFASKGAGLAVLELEDLPDFYSTIPGVKLEWPTYRIGTERWRYFLPAGPLEKELVLPFTSVWRATEVPGVEIDCTLTTSAGEQTVATEGRMGRFPPPIDESKEAEEEAAAEAEEEEAEEKAAG
jgi:hypothetical protein